MNFIKKKILSSEANFYSKKIYLNLLLNNAISRSAIAAVTRSIDPIKPETWEFSGFSQNGEDGIIQYLLTGLRSSNKFFIEIGSGNGLENTTSYLGHIKKFTGLQIEGNRKSHEDALIIRPWLVESLNLFVNEITIDQIYEKALFKNPDVFALDIDGMDYYIMKLLFEKGLRPKIVVVEYNSGFGPDRKITLPYNPVFNMFAEAYPYLYYGVSVNGWKTFFSKYNYEFITVESNGVNAFFINKDEFKGGFTNNISKNEFRENIHQTRLFKTSYSGQFDLLKNLPLVEI